MRKGMIGVGIVGYGYMGYFHRRKIEEMSHMKLCGIYDMDDEKTSYAKEEGIHVYEDFDQMLEDDGISLVIVSTPNDSHFHYSLMALEAGKNVLCEKPAMLTLKELDEILKVANEKERLFTAHQNRRWDKDFSVVRKVVQGGQIGGIWTIYSETYGQRGVCFGWRADPAKGGGMVYDWGVHLIDQMLTLFPQKKVVSVEARLRSILTPVVDDYFEIGLEFEEDIVGHINVGTFALQDRPRWFVFGDKGTLRLDDFSGSVGGVARIKDNVRFFSRVKKNSNLGPSRTMAHLERQDYDEIRLPMPDDDSLGFYNNLQETLLGNEDIAVTPEEIRRDMEIIEKVFESNRTQRRIPTEI